MNNNDLSSGARMLDLARALFPICRSITGDGTRETLAILASHIPLAKHEVPSGTPVLDWIVPREWNIRGAYIARLDGTRIVDFANNNLHIVQYSTPQDRIVSRAELASHLHILPDHPDWIPYRTAYYSENWGFCLTQSQFDGLSDDSYRVFIDASLAAGHLSYGECFIPGANEQEVLLSCHVCHPSLANDNLSGMVVAAALAQYLSQIKRRFSYRLLFVPGTIGSLTWLARNEDRLGSIRHGLVLSCLGDAGGLTYKQSRSGDAPIDRIVARVLRGDTRPHSIRPFSPLGYDERQYCSPGFNLPVGCLMRTPHGEYREYHSSADDLSLLRADSLEHALNILQRVVNEIESGVTYVSANQKGEPQLGRRGLYPAMGGQRSAGREQMARLWVLNLADGHHSLMDTAERAGLPLEEIRVAADALAAAGLISALP